MFLEYWNVFETEINLILDVFEHSKNVFGFFAFFTGILMVFHDYQYAFYCTVFYEFVIIN